MDGAWVPVGFHLSYGSRFSYTVLRLEQDCQEAGRERGNICN